MGKMSDLFIRTNSIREQLGIEFCRVKKEKKLTIRQISQLSGIHRGSIQRLERCNPYHPRFKQQYKWMPSLTVLLMLFGSLGYDIIITVVHDGYNNLVIKPKEVINEQITQSI